MGKLDEYRGKRDFGATPEPSGEAASSAGLTYVIQKHAASHLHWDFRIELDGVLLSWAVPKGPSLDSSVKRLAMHVEDHPVEYGSFEGAIPEGEYGGGTVMLWDRGTWRPDHGDPREHLAEGHLKFDLFGERLRGRWMLVRTKGYGGSGKDSWLLFKERDEEARSAKDFDPTVEWTTSVATGRSMDEIAADPMAEPARDVAGAREATMPRTLEVELATLVKRVPDGDEWFHEIKYDGYRIVAFKDDAEVRLLSRNGKDWTERFPQVVSAVAGLGARQAVLDGEVVVMRPDGTTDFQALQNLARRGEPAELHYVIFDLVYLDGSDLSGSALEDRKRLLAGLLGAETAGVLRYSDHLEGHGDAFFTRACDYHLEGVVSKRRDSAYRGGRGRDWTKTKCIAEQEFVVVGYTDPGGTRSDFGALVIAVRDADGTFRQVGRVGTGFTEESLADIRSRLARIERSEPPVSNPPKGAQAAGVHWVEPRLVAEVAFTEWTAEGKLRHPSFVGLREDKPVEEVVVETPVAPPTAPEPRRSRPGRGKPPKELVAGVALTNPGKVFWPDVGVTKLELARYYESVAELMLPHVANRPLSLVRCPEGYTGECFYQKHIEHFPSAVGSVGIHEPEEDATVPYAKVTGLAGLVGLVQMGVLEIHPWGSRADDPDKPDRLVFDLDPDPDLPWKTVATTALLLRSELRRLGLESWLKTTGGKGLHVVVPVTRRQTWAEAREFSRAFVDHIVAMEPRLFTASMSKSQRGRRIFIDYVRNTRGATSIAPYSTRARAGAPVSVPMFWDELDDAAERPVFGMRDMAAHLAALDGDPWKDMLAARQSLTKAMRASLGMD